MIIESSFAADNETNQLTINNDDDKLSLTSDIDVNSISTNDKLSLTTKDKSNSLKLNKDSTKLASTNEYYFDASTSSEGSGTNDNPYKDFNKDNLKPSSINHLKNGEYHLDYSLESSDMTFIGEVANKTIIKCDGNQIKVTRSLNLINVTLYDFTIRNEGTLQATNAIFDGGYAIKDDKYGNSFGGAIHTPYGSKTYKVNIDNCTFRDCMAEYGGAIYMDSGELNIKDSLFINNLAFNYGGAIAAEYGTKLSINKTRFINDKSFEDAGGAIYLKTSTLNARNIEIINSTATFGAAITALNSKVRLYKLIAENNTAQFEGGAIYQMYGEFSMQQSRFINNTARNGGAIFIDNVTMLNIPSNIFENNKAKLTAGAIYLIASPKNIFSNKYINNNAKYYKDSYESPIYNASIIGTGGYELIINKNTNLPEKIPSYYNLLDDGLVTSVKDQYYGGNCWAFSTLASLESCILKATGKEYDFSEENMKNLIQLYSDYGLTLDTNDGGYIATGIGYLVSWLGPINETDDKYDDCTVLSPLINSLMHVQNVVLLKRDDYTDNDAIKEAILQYGAVGTGIGYYSDYFNNNTNAYYCGYGGINHAVTIVGWNDTYSKSNFLKQPKGDGAWIVKNSWGESWGNDGYFYVSYYDWNIAKTGMLESSFTFILNETMKYDKNYQYDVCGKTSYSTAHGDEIWYENIFTATDNESLAAVSTYFEKKTNWTVSIFVNDTLKLIKNGTSNAGYYTLNLGQLIPLNIGDTFKVVFKVQSTDSYTKFPISAKEGSNKFISHEGLSYFSYDGETWHDLYTSLIPSVACIKAFTLTTKITSTLDLKVNYDKYNPVEIIATVKDEYNRIIQNGNIIFKLDDEEIKIAISDGQAKLIHNFKNEGLNTITAIFDEAPYKASTKTSKINIIKIPLELSLKINQDNNNITISLSLSKELNSKIEVLINDNTEIVDLIKGKATLKLKNLTNGDYTIKAILKDTLYSANKDSIFKVNYTEIIPIPIPINNTNNTNSSSNNDTSTNSTTDNGTSTNTNNTNSTTDNGTSTNTNNTNSDSDNATSGNNTKTNTTNSTNSTNTNSTKDTNTTNPENGNINVNNGTNTNTLPTNNPEKASETNTKTNTKTQTNKSTKQTKNEIVLKTKTIKTIKKSAKKLVLTATLKINKKSKKDKTITFIVNGKKFKVKTNKKGIAKLTIKKPILKKLLKKVKIGKKIKYQIKYGKTKVTKTMLVKK